MTNTQQRHIYLRDYTKANKHPVGCVAMVIDRATNQIRYALSACSPTDRWSAKVASDKAIGRLVKEPIVIEGEIPTAGYNITRRVMEHIIATHNAQSRDKSRSKLAFESAKAWLVNSDKYTQQSAS